MKTEINFYNYCVECIKESVKALDCNRDASKVLEYYGDTLTARDYFSACIKGDDIYSSADEQSEHTMLFEGVDGLESVFDLARVDAVNWWLEKLGDGRL